MKVIGLLGGMSWESTKTYYELLNIGVKARLAGLNSARVLLNSVNFAPLEDSLGRSDWTAIEQILCAEARRLEAGGADCLLLCTNTMHKIFDAIEGSISIPAFHIADPLGQKLKASHVSTIGLLGTRFTMTEDFYSGRLKKKFGITSLVPKEDEVERIDQVIFDELCVGEITEDAKSDYLKSIDALIEKGAQAIAFACTEIALLIRQEDVSVPVFDTTELHAEFALNWALDPNQH